MSEVWSSGMVGMGTVSWSEVNDMSVWASVEFTPLNTTNCLIVWPGGRATIVCDGKQVEEHDLRQDPPVYEDDGGDGRRYISPSGRLHPDDCMPYSRFRFGNLIDDGHAHNDKGFPWPFRKDGKINSWYSKEVEKAECSHP